ncbi:phosphoadenylyl-sulfate reductase [Alphaproteobacteria bacterium KMM 3653]|uniref:Adenosine 5'-phosphosulfate reductase n=1 Tax=Harenicola maris TaxID=2841044 RepID=A0AAP2CM53_9RHOB|nr:phosphoadenylyl-sulfate reductase [Harenicola maris]
MQLEAHPIDALTRAGAIGARLTGRNTATRLAQALSAPEAGRVALVSSFGADAVALLHMVSRLNRDLPVLFIDTEMLFPETLAYQQEVTEHLGLTDVRVLKASELQLFQTDPQNDLHKTNTDACCGLRKTVPLAAALMGFDTWISGRKRHQAQTRAALPLIEADGAHVKLNPLADWPAEDITAYLNRHDLPRHPLVAQGYRSIGCAPCTRPVLEGEDPRAGRWSGQDKVECGIHFSADGTMRRGPVTKAPAHD